MYRVLATFVSVIVVVGCGTASPTSPLTGGATISGSLVGSTTGSPNVGSGTTQAAAPSAGVVVSVVGTAVSATVDANDQFTLTNVPAGNIDLRFTGVGLGGTVTLGAIAAAENVSVTITRSGPSLALDTIRRRDGDREELEGRVDGLPPTTAEGTFTVSGQSVQTDRHTLFFKGDAPAAFADLAIGVRVHVKGTPNAAGVLAGTVRIQNVNADLGVQVEGVVANFTGVATAFQFTVNGRLIKGDATTAFDDHSAFTSLANGVRVGVRGLLKDGFIQATKIEVARSPR